MKNIKLFGLILIAFASLWSCEDDDTLDFVAAPQEGFMFTNSTLEQYILTETTASNLGERFTWNDAEFDVPTNVTYELESSSTEDFTAPLLVGTTSENELAVTIEQLTIMANAAGYDNDPDTPEPDAGALYFRVKAQPGSGTSASEILSDTQTINVYLPAEIVEEPALPNLFLVGDATAPGWSNNDNNPALIRDPGNQDMFTYRAYFQGGGEGFKLLEVLGQWQPQWGAADGENAAVNDGTSSDPSAFSVPASGYYEFTINKAEMTYTFVEYDASSAPTYTTLGIIGSSTAGGWDSDTDLVQSTFDPHIWNLTNVELTDGELKIRADNDWAIAWGSTTALSGFGSIEPGSPNIPVAAGTYDIWFNDLDGGYILIPVE